MQPGRNDMEENAEMRACVKLMCPRAVPSYGEEGEQRTALHRAVWELFGWARSNNHTASASGAGQE